MPCKSTHGERLAEEGQQRGNVLGEEQTWQASAWQTGKVSKGGDNPHPSTGERRKMRSIHTAGYYPAVKRCEVHD